MVTNTQYGDQGVNPNENNIDIVTIEGKISENNMIAPYKDRASNNVPDKYYKMKYNTMFTEPYPARQFLNANKNFLINDDNLLIMDSLRNDPDQRKWEIWKEINNYIADLKLDSSIFSYANISKEDKQKKINHLSDLQNKIEKNNIDLSNAEVIKDVNEIKNHQDIREKELVRYRKLELLHYATHLGLLDEVKEYLSQNIDPTQRDFKSHITPIDLAVNDKKWPIVTNMLNSMLKTGKVNINEDILKKFNLDHAEFFKIAVEEGNSFLLNNILKNHNNIIPSKLNDVLENAVLSHDKETVNIILEIMKDKKMLSVENVKNALFFAVEDGEEDIVKNFFSILSKENIQYLANLQFKDENKIYSLLSNAVRNGHVSTAKYLLEKCGVDQLNIKNTSLFESVISCNDKQKQVELIELLLKYKENLNENEKNDINKILSNFKEDKIFLQSAEKGFSNLLKFIYNNSGNKQSLLVCSNDNLETPLGLAAKNGHVDIVETLLNTGNTEQLKFGSVLQRANSYNEDPESKGKIIQMISSAYGSDIKISPVSNKQNLSQNESREDRLVKLLNDHIGILQADLNKRPSQYENRMKIKKLFLESIVKHIKEGITNKENLMDIAAKDVYNTYKDSPVFHLPNDFNKAKILIIEEAKAGHKYLGLFGKSRTEDAIDNTIKNLNPKSKL
ncbi:MAG: hypothetical protein HYU63_06880 [Armatimonadetes bacterium]|nr:hypothetical protein [Armatimonadota bacterium]